MRPIDCISESHTGTRTGTVTVDECFSPPPGAIVTVHINANTGASAATDLDVPVDGRTILDEDRNTVSVPVTAAAADATQPATHDKPATPTHDQSATHNQPATQESRFTPTPIPAPALTPTPSLTSTSTSTSTSTLTSTSTSTSTSTPTLVPNATEITEIDMKIDMHLDLELATVYKDSASVGHGAEPGDATQMRLDLGRAAIDHATAHATATVSAVVTSAAAAAAIDISTNATDTDTTATDTGPAAIDIASASAAESETKTLPPDSECAPAHQHQDGTIIADDASCTNATATATSAANGVAAHVVTATVSTPLPNSSRADTMDVSIDKSDDADRYADAHVHACVDGGEQNQDQSQSQDQDTNADAKKSDDMDCRSDGVSPVLDHTHTDGDGNNNKDNNNIWNGNGDSGDLGRVQGDADARRQIEAQVSQHTPIANSSCAQPPEPQLQPQTKPKPKPKTHADHMRALILRKVNPQGVFDVQYACSDCDTDQTNADTNTRVDTQTNTTANINALTTPWRFVFNTHYEVEDEVKEIPAYSWMTRRVRYPDGKRLSTNGMWAATLADFYRVASWHDPPTVPKAPDDKSKPDSSSSALEYERCQGPRRCTVVAPMKVVTSSMLLARYASVVTGDVRHDRLRQVLRIAETEEGPQILPVYSIAKLVRGAEAWKAQSAPGGASWAKMTLDDLNNNNDIGCEEGERAKKRPRERWEVDEPWPPESIFSPRAYPRPWTLEPFQQHHWHAEYDLTSWVNVPTLQSYIPQHLLPAKLIVHDPWEVLSGLRCTAEDQYTAPFTQKKDIVRVFKLSLDRRPRYDSDREEEQKELDREEARRTEFLACPKSGVPLPAGMFYEPRRCVEDEGDGTEPAKPPVYVVFPARPRKVAPKEAHLYLAPSEKMGSGHHSYVYRAELEVPRSMLVEDVICEDCVRADVKRILEEEDGIDGEKREPKWDDQTAGRYVLKLRKLRDGKRRKVMFGSEEAMCEWDDKHYRVTKEQSQLPDVHIEYEGPYRAVQTKVGYQNLERAPYCEHLRMRSENIHPLTARVYVAAKLASRDDSEDHLPKEALNYQAFPKHFFEHRTGYNLSESEHPFVFPQAPVPPGALVPQFYGYYEADWKDQNNRNLKGEREHLSPILLMEDCGQAIDPDKMSVDDRNECISLFLRMHAAGWIHNSLYRRNIVRQPGPLSEHPVIRRSQSYRQGRNGYGLHWSFRLIDFGRSATENDSHYYYSNWEDETERLIKWIQRGVLT